jgi:Spy/CpxP family protein refolding chaperone
MERKGFLAAAVGAATAVVATGFAAAAAPPVIPPPTMEPRPYPTPTGNHHWQRNQQKSDRNITRVRTHLERVIDELQHDQRDYDGHREKALDLLQRARTELLAAENYDREHPNG